MGPPETEKILEAKDTVNKTKWQSTELEKIFTNPTSDRGLISKICKELKKLNIKIPNHQKMGYRSKKSIQQRNLKWPKDT